MSLHNICAILWNFALFDTIFSVVHIPSHCNIELCHYKNKAAKPILDFIFIPNPALGTVCLVLWWKEDTFRMLVCMP